MSTPRLPMGSCTVCDDGDEGVDVDLEAEAFAATKRRIALRRPSVGHFGLCDECKGEHYLDGAYVHEDCGGAHDFKGWYCIRSLRHDGPCALIPASPLESLVRTTMKYRELQDTPPYLCTFETTRYGHTYTCNGPAYIVPETYDGGFWYGIAFCPEHDPRPPSHGISAVWSHLEHVFIRVCKAVGRVVNP